MTVAQISTKQPSPARSRASGQARAHSLAPCQPGCAAQLKVLFYSRIRNRVSTYSVGNELPREGVPMERKRKINRTTRATAAKRTEMRKKKTGGKNPDLSPGARASLRPHLQDGGYRRRMGGKGGGTRRGGSPPPQSIKKQARREAPTAPPRPPIGPPRRQG